MAADRCCGFAAPVEPNDQRMEGARLPAIEDLATVQERLEAILGEDHHISSTIVRNVTQHQRSITGDVPQIEQVEGAECGLALSHSDVPSLRPS